MEQDLFITDLIQIFEGEFNPGHFNGPKNRKHDGLVFYLEGEAIYRFEDYALRAMPGTFFFLAKGSRYTIDIQEKSKYICIDFHFTESPLVRKSSVFQPIPPSVREDFIALLHEWNQNRPRRIPHSLGIIYKLYAEAITSETSRDGRKEHLFLRASSYILEHSADPNLTVQEVADHIQVSEVHLRRIFRDMAGQSPNRYLNSTRLEKAKNMLRFSNLPIYEIAFSVGFSDQYYFSRLFKNETGLPPSEYKKMYS